MDSRTSIERSDESDVVVRPLGKDDLVAADQVMRLAFGTFLGLPDPLAFMGDASYVPGRWTADPEAAFGAFSGGRLVGSNFATNWGSVGFFGPLTIRPELWDRGVGKRLMEPVMDCFDRWETKHAGLFTFAHSQKHVGLYQRFGFWPRFLTAIKSKPVDRERRIPGWTSYSTTRDGERGSVLGECRRLTNEIHPGLDVSAEIEAVNVQRLGETILLWGSKRLAGLAVCHCGPNTEAGGGTCYVKFGAVAPGPNAEQDFVGLLEAVEHMAGERGLYRLSAGVNLAREEAYGLMRRQGFRVDLQGVAMHRPNECGYSRSGVFLIDDWR